MTDQEQARERAAQELAKRLAHVTTLADTLAFARQYWADAAAGGWRWVPKTVSTGLPPGHTPPRPDTYQRGAAAARAALDPIVAARPTEPEEA